MASNFNTIFAASHWPAALAEHGQSVTHVSVGGVTTVITAIVTWQDQSEFAAAGRWPSVSILLSALATAPAKGDSLTIGSQTYQVFAVHPDSAGAVRLETNRTA
jgi:hypothetical protein